MSSKYQSSKRKRGLTEPCKQCRRRVYPEQRRPDGLCSTCATDRASKWLRARTGRS